MSNQAFFTPSSSILTAQPVSATAVYARSTDAGDAMSLDIFGTISASPGSSSVTLAGKVEVEASDSFTALTHAVLASAATGTVTGYAAGTAGDGDITALVNPADGDTLTIGLVGFTQAYRFKNTLASAYDVKIGATASDTMANLKAALNADGTPGTEYYAGTLANPYLSATVATTVVTVTDRIPCNRQLGWSFTESASNFALRVPDCGVDGLLLFSFSPSAVLLGDQLTFSSEDHSTVTLPALMVAVSNYVQTNGVAPMLRLWCDQSIDYKVQSSTDLINWTDTSEGTVTLSASSLTYINLAERADFIRFVIVTNANVTDSIADFRVIY